MREQGRVEWFDKKLGYGFISRGSGPDVFVHYSKMREEQSLDPGDIVEFEVKDIARRNGGKKPQAFDVVLIKQVSTSKLREEEATK